MLNKQEGSEHYEHSTAVERLKQILEKCVSNLETLFFFLFVYIADFYERNAKQMVVSVAVNTHVAFGILPSLHR